MGLIDLKAEDGDNAFRYFINVQAERKEVCHKSFLHFHSITPCIIRKVQDRLKRGEVSAVDGRGKAPNPHKVSDEVRESIKTHILSYRFEPVHYSRERGADVYLPSDVTIPRMYEDFKAKHPNIIGVENKEWLYREIFASLNVLPRQPLTDTCKNCDLLHVSAASAPAIERNAFEDALQYHQSNAEQGYKSMYEDIRLSRIDPNLEVKCIDLQQILYSPTLTHQDMYYLRQFASYNFCIYDGKEDKDYMSFWTETEGHKGVNEIGSSLLAHIRAKYAILQPNQQRTLILWSDRCPGQNNNFQMVALSMFLIKSGYFTRIQQKFLVTGHTFLPCDRLFSMIEKRKRVCKAYVPEHWIEIIKSASVSNPFEVHRLTQDHIFNMHKLTEVFRRPATLKITKVILIDMNAEKPYEILTRADHLQGAWECHIMNAIGRQRIPVNLANFNVQLEPCYNGPFLLPESKRQNLRLMIPFLPPEYRQFYENLI